MKKLYIDFDGVIMTTNERIEKLLDENKIDRTNYEQTLDFCSKIKWDSLLEQSMEISNAFNNLKKLANSDIFNISILTHVCSNEEANAKKEIINRNVGNIQVIPVPKSKEKCHFVDPKDAILVDDYSKNLELWEQNGGIGIKFTNKDYDRFKAIYDLSKITELV